MFTLFLLEKIRHRIVIGLAILTSIIIIALLFIPHLIDLEIAQKSIISQISESTGGKFTYRQLDLHWFPRPRIVILSGSLALPEDQYVSVSSVKIYPMILPLLKGEVYFKRIDVIKPHSQIRINVKKRAGPLNIEGSKPSQRFRERMVNILNQTALLFPGVEYSIRNGRIDILSAASSHLHIRNLDAQLRYLDSQLYLNVKCQSNVGNKIFLTGWIQPDNFAGNGQLRIERFRPHLLLSQFSLRLPFQVTESSVNLRLNLKSESLQTLTDLMVSNVYIRIQNDAEKVEIKGRNAQATIRTKPRNTIVSLSKFLFDTPQMNVSGHLFIDHDAPEVGLELSGIDLHIDPIRKTAQIIGGGNRSIENIFKIIAGGKVPVISISGRGRSLVDLGRIENLTVKGSMAEGQIFIPGPRLHLKGVVGDATIYKGILRGKRLQAVLGESNGYNGEMTLGLYGPKPPFHLEIDTVANVSQLRRILLRFVKDKRLIAELKRISQLTGRAKGRLIIGDHLEKIQVSAYVTEANFQGITDRIPVPIKISGGTYEFAHDRFTGHNFDAKIGQSNFSGISGEWKWNPHSMLTITTKNSRIDLNALHRWLGDFDSLKEAMQTFQIKSGVAELSTLSITREMEVTPSYHFEIDGTVRQASINRGQSASSMSMDIPKLIFSARSTVSGATEIELSGKQIQWGQGRMDVSGRAQVEDNIFNLDLDIAADSLSWDHFAVNNQRRVKTVKNGSFWGQRIRGVIRVKTEEFTYDSWKWQSILAKVIFAPTSTTVAIQKADLCGIPFPGKIRITSDNVQVDFSPQAKEKDLAPDFSCFWDREGIVTGQYSLAASLNNQTTESGLIRNLNGNLDFKARSGRIHRYGILAKVLALLNLTEVFKGKLPDIAKDGFAYDTITAHGKFENGKFVLKEGIINGASMTVIYQGSFNMLDETLKLTVFVSPFKTIDSIVKKIPLVNNVFGGRFVSIPFSVNGKWSDYEVTPLVTDPSMRHSPLTVEN